MSNAFKTSILRWRDIVNLVLGVWLFVSPWLLRDAPVRTLAWNVYLMGAIIALAAVLALVVFQEWEEWMGLLAAVWLIVTPWAMGIEFAGKLVWSSLIVGIVVGILALWSVVDARTRGSPGKDAHA